MSELKEILREKFLPLIAEEKLELVELEFFRRPPRSILRVYVDKVGGVNVEECAHLSQKLSDFLDMEDLIPEGLVLEVSSPGLERPLLSLDDFRRKRGEKVKVYLKIPLEEKREIEGEIEGISQGEVILKIENVRENIPLEKIEKGKIIF